MVATLLFHSGEKKNRQQGQEEVIKVVKRTGLRWKTGSRRREDAVFSRWKAGPQDGQNNHVGPALRPGL